MLELNKIYNEDCIEGMKLIDDKSIDMILCDLPYGTTACSWDIIIPFDKLWEQYKRIIKNNGAIILTASQPFTTDLINSNRDWFKYEWIWNKVAPANFNNAKYQPMKIHENILIFGKDKIKYNPIKEKAKIENIRPIDNKEHKANHYGGVHYNNKCDIYNRFPKSIIKINKRNAECNPLNIIHPTQKPVALFEYLIRTYSNENDIILDNCMGSGTTAIACLNLNRKYIGFELDKQYYDLSIKRIDDYNKQLKLF
jgi:site-specific DNA-methyltransferase (adenine-specific)